MGHLAFEDVLAQPESRNGAPVDAERRSLIKAGLAFSILTL